MSATGSAPQLHLWATHAATILWSYFLEFTPPFLIQWVKLLCWACRMGPPTCPRPLAYLELSKGPMATLTAVSGHHLVTVWSLRDFKASMWLNSWLSHRDWRSCPPFPSSVTHYPEPFALVLGQEPPQGLPTSTDDVFAASAPLAARFI